MTDPRTLDALNGDDKITQTMESLIDALEYLDILVESGQVSRDWAYHWKRDNLKDFQDQTGVNLSHLT